MPADEPEPAAPRPGWLDAVARRVRAGDGTLLAAARAAEDPSAAVRASAVLLLFGAYPAGGYDVVLTERSSGMRSHAGQVSFPGGAIDAADSGPSSAALREAREEVGLDPAGVEVVAELTTLYLPPSRFLVTPVLAWWARPSPLSAVDPNEVAVVARVPVAELTDPANRFVVTHPSGYTGPAFEVGGLFVWGFTAGVLSAVLELAGLARTWDTARRLPLPDRFLRERPVP